MAGPAAPVVIFWPEIAAAAATAAAWAARIYRVYKVAKTAEAVTAAQSAEEVDSAAKEKAKTDAQAKADDAASSDCKNCDPDPNCDKWRENVKRALYGAKPSKGGGDKGLAQRLCEWMHGTLPGGGDHNQSVTNGLESIEKNMDKIKKTKHRCPAPTDLEKEAKEYQDAFKDPDLIPHLPRSDFKEFCNKKALELAQKHLGK